MRRPLFAVLLAAPSLATGCDWTVFDDLSDQAPTRVVDEPDDYRTTDYGRLLAAVRGDRPEGEVSRFAANGGAGSGVVIFEGWSGGAFTIVELDEFCRRADDCDEDVGSALFGIPFWRSETDRRDLCFVATQPANAKVRVECEVPVRMAEDQPLVLAAGSLAGTGIGASGAALVEGTAATAPAGVAVLGAPGANGGRGGVFRMTDAAVVIELPTPDGVVAAGAALGTRVAATRRSETEFWVAASTFTGDPEGSVPGRVVVYALAASGASEVRACLDPPSGAESAGFGQSLAFGDLDGDDVPDLIVGNDADAPVKPGAVWVYSGSGLPAAAGAGCQAWGEAVRTVECVDGLRGVACLNGGFGDAVAAGDVDADGDDDLLVGAPLADVDDAGSAGAVYVVPGGPGGPGGPTGVPPSILVDTSPESDEELGRSVVAVPSNLAGVERAEIVAGAPRAARLYVFLCSEPELTSTSPSDRCQPAP